MRHAIRFLTVEFSNDAVTKSFTEKENEYIAELQSSLQKDALTCLNNMLRMFPVDHDIVVQALKIFEVLDFREKRDQDS